MSVAQSLGGGVSCLLSSHAAWIESQSQRNLHLSSRRQRQMCIRDRSLGGGVSCLLPSL